MLRGVWQASNFLSIRATYCVIIAGASPGETKMWSAVRENGDFFALAVRITGETVEASVEFYLYPTVGTVLIHSIKPELTE